MPLQGLPSGILGLSSLSAGEAHTCVVVETTTGNGVTCMGDDQYAQSSPFLMGNFPDVCSGLSHSCAVQSTGLVWCWGRNEKQQSNPTAGDLTTRNTGPVQALSSGNPLRVTCGASFACALLSSNITCWGANESHQLDVSTATTVSNSTTSISGVTSLAGGWAHFCFGTDGGVWCRGNNLEGQASGAQGAPVSPAQRVGGLPNQVPQALAAGSEFTCGLFSGAVWCWGNNDSGQLGRPGLTRTPAPVLMSP